MFGVEEDTADAADDLAALLRVIEASPPLVAAAGPLPDVQELLALPLVPSVPPVPPTGLPPESAWLEQLEALDADALLHGPLEHLELDLEGSGSATGSISGTDSHKSVKKARRKKQPKDKDASAKRARQSALAAKRRNAYRQRIKKELLDLRSQSSELSAKLKTMQEETEVTGKLRRLREDPEPGTSPPSAALVAPGWKGIAVRQMEGRLEAEALNRELRTQVSMNRALIQHISNALRLRMNAVDAHRRRSIALSHQKRVRLEESDSRLFHTFLREVDGVYRKTDEVFRDCERLFKTDEPLTSNYRRKWDRDTNSECVEFVDTIVVPFGFRKAPNALWRAMPKIFGKEVKPTIVAVGDPKTTLAMKYHFIYHHDEERTPFQCCWLMKRYDEPNRSVFVWRALSEGEGDVSVVQSVETGWCVVKPSPSGAAPTIFQFCTRVWPVRPPAAISENANYGQEVEHLVDLMMRSSEDETVDIARAIENVLLEDTVAARDDEASVAL